MRCQWQALFDILPEPYLMGVNACGADRLLEIRLRCGENPRLVCLNRIEILPFTVKAEHLTHIVNLASRFSPWTAASSAMGYITSRGGHRIGICGEVVMKNGVFSGFRTMDSLSIRVCRDVSGISVGLPMTGNLLILGAPGTGKTTLLRDYARKLAEQSNVCVVDERCELFPEGFARGRCLDVLSGCPKGQGMERLLRVMNPEYIVVDEITSDEDTRAVLQCAYCGVNLLATAHAGSFDDFRRRSVYKPLVHEHIFDHIVLMHRDKTCHLEENALCG